jgi:EAL domain-containing protein (putative c-di-GMP-specific phosphodiesterase class I)
LEEAPVGADRLHLEVTEAALTFQTVVAEEVIGALAAQGIAIAIDDFGTGFTGLSRLRTVQVSEVKIDRRVLADLQGNENDHAVLRSVIDLGHSLGFLVTAVGVESQDVADDLVSAGCDQAQGSLWLPPSPWTDVAEVFGDTATVAACGPSTRQGAPAQAGHGSEGGAR